MFCIDIGIDGAKMTVGIALVLSRNQGSATHCTTTVFFPATHLKYKKMVGSVKHVLGEALQMTTFIKSQLLRTFPSIILGDEMRSVHKAWLLHLK